MGDNADHVILICTTCRGTSGAHWARETLSVDLPAGFCLRAVDCMAGCARPLSVGFQAPGKASYLFGDIDTHDDLRALLDFAKQYQDSGTGWTSATDRPAALYEKTLARLPGLKAEACQ